MDYALLWRVLVSTKISVLIQVIANLLSTAPAEQEFFCYVYMTATQHILALKNQFMAYPTDFPTDNARLFAVE